MPTIDPLNLNRPALDEVVPQVAGNPGNQIEAASDPKYRAKVEQAAEKFEAFFIGNMLKQMRSATRELADEDSIYKNRINQDMLEMADGKLADTMAGQRAFGIADAILRQMLPPAAVTANAAVTSSEPTVAASPAPLSRR
ncbi:MAG TPA: rod-binding protein [Rhodocyclaceae bacterium]|nr:rod-binding protein [Rhodocyclaceae bacterium]